MYIYNVISNLHHKKGNYWIIRVVFFYWVLYAYYTEDNERKRYFISIYIFVIMKIDFS